MSPSTPATAQAATTGPSANPSATETINPSEIGWIFVHQYYTILNRDPSRLHCFYNRGSLATHGVEGEEEGGPLPRARGQSEINALFERRAFQDCKVIVSSVDAQPTLAGGILVQALGEMSNRGGHSQKFTQTFVLAEQPSGYYVLNDIFRYLKDEVEMTGFEQAPPPPAPSTVSSSSSSSSSVPPAQPTTQPKAPTHEQQPASAPQNGPAPPIPQEVPSIPQEAPTAPEPSQPNGQGDAVPEPEASNQESQAQKEGQDKVIPPAPEATDAPKAPQESDSRQAEQTKASEKKKKEEEEKSKKEEKNEGKGKISAPTTTTQDRSQAGKPTEPTRPQQQQQAQRQAKASPAQAQQPAPRPAPAAPKTWASLAARAAPASPGPESTTTSTTSISSSAPQTQEPPVQSNPPTTAPTTSSAGPRIQNGSGGRREGTTVFVRNLGSNVNGKALLERLFRDFGRIRQIDTIPGKGIAFVDFVDLASAKQVLAQREFRISSSSSEVIIVEERRRTTAPANANGPSNNAGGSGSSYPGSGGAYAKSGGGAGGPRGPGYRQGHPRQQLGRGGRGAGGAGRTDRVA